MANKSGHGGKREGAGRPRSAASIAEANAFVAKKMRGLAEDGWEVLAESYPDLMRTAIEQALGMGDVKPSIPMLKTLIEMMPKLATGSEEETMSEAAKILERHLNRVTESNV